MNASSATSSGRAVMSSARRRAVQQGPERQDRERPGSREHLRRRARRVHEDGVHAHAQHVRELPGRVPGPHADDPAADHVRGDLRGERLRRDLGADGEARPRAEPRVPQPGRRRADEPQQLAPGDDPAGVLERRGARRLPQRGEKGSRKKAHCSAPRFRGQCVHP
nr:hypothetical protein [Actinomadura madurae]